MSRITKKFINSESSVAGAALRADGGGKAVWSRGSFRTITGADAVAATDEYILVNVAGTVTLTLPDISATDRVVYVKMIGTGQVDITPFGAQTLDGAASLSLRKQYQAIVLAAISGNWHLW